MKHIYGFEGFLNESLAFNKEVNLLDPKLKGLIKVEVYSQAITITDLSWEDTAAPPKLITGAKFGIFSPSLIQITVPAGQLTKTERLFIKLTVPGLVNPKKPNLKTHTFARFDYPYLTSSGSPYSGGDADTFIFHQHVGHLSAEKRTMNVKGGILELRIDLSNCTKDTRESEVDHMKMHKGCTGGIRPISK